MKCELCKFWNVNSRWGEEKDKAQCRVNPPTIRKSYMACDASGEWPTTRASDWCGKFEQR